MAQIEYIKYLYENEGKSLSYIAKATHLDFRTVKKYAERYDWSPNKNVISKDRYPVLGAYIEIIDAWLTEDLKYPRKQRHTAQRVYDRLVKEHNFQGGLRTVSAYVSQKKAKLYQKTTGYLPLKHNPSEAQLDFGELVYLKGDSQKKAYYLNLSFPYSNAAFVQVFESQNQECVMEGLKRIFRFIGGVPSMIVMDNMSAVVTKILPNGERRISENFSRFALHYRFKMAFCNPASGNEKGNIENKVGYHRRNYFVPVPQIDDIEEFNTSLWDMCIEDMDRLHYKHQLPMQELWQQDRQHLLYLPENEYEVFRLHEAHVDNYGFIEYDKNKYTVSPELMGKKVTVKVYYNELRIFYDHKHIVTYKRCYKTKQEIIDWKLYLPLLTKKPGALEHTKFYEQLPKLWREHLKKVSKEERKTALALLKEIVDDDKINEGSKALMLAYEYGKSDIESIRQCYYNLTHDTYNPNPCSFDKEPPRLNYNPELTVYNTLTERQADLDGYGNSSVL